jgi:hypothetical protein
MIATFVRTKTLTIDEYRDVKTRAETEREVTRQIAEFCADYEITWANTMLFDEQGRWSKGWRCVGKGEGAIE